MIGDAVAELEDGVLTLTVDLRPQRKARPTDQGATERVGRPEPPRVRGPLAQPVRRAQAPAAPIRKGRRERSSSTRCAPPSNASAARPSTRASTGLATMPAATPWPAWRRDHARR